MRTSGACHIYDLGQAFVKAGSQANIIVPDSAQAQDVNIHVEDGVRVIRVRALHTKDVGYFQRTIAEFLNPFLMWRRLKKNPQFLQEKIDGVVWYSPTIFWGPLIARLKKQFQAKSYLILRDLFPDWALDLGIIKKGPIYWFLKTVENFQYQQADIIGVQSPNNLNYFKKENPSIPAKIEVLWNWIGELKESPCSIDLQKTKLAFRKICIYAGNMGVAQGINSLISLAEASKSNAEFGFIFVGRGSEVKRLRSLVLDKRLENVLFFDEVDPSEILSLCKQCSVGLIALDPRHKTQNIPGKFLTYIQAGLPVICFGNKGNDLQNIILQYGLGDYYDGPIDLAIEKVLTLMKKHKYKNVVKLSEEKKESVGDIFSLKSACIQIASHFKNG